ncbi:MotA/TolQ/ExbB proton channel family protein [Saccharibacter sp. 17.LH.SD]|uniref:MotA/TolQ/ExbB proton channel family protein n=1 Tax=Saccharibacter sp. 17.LH.SD TaxID=2689393 RepID=UPI00136EA543|nr:MotA/TolQ/ExbB proton channel family protein [Saccharibacter sp. 17.LH.SD]MXV45026.1 MotA/TolQ/ExbB proton channel family protein [Saccharibacter sp. 17.LH.SD]
MTRLFRLPVTPASPKARAVTGTALALTLALGSLSASTALAQSTTQPNQATQAPTAPAAPPVGATPAAPPAGATPAEPPAGTSATATQQPAGAPTTDTPANGTPVSATPVSDKAEDSASQENPYGLKALWKNGDIIARSVLIIMALMSIGTWIILVTKFIEQARVFKAARDAGRNFWTQDSVQNGAKTLKADSPFRYIAETGIAAAQHHEGSMRDSIDLHSWTAMSIQRSIETIHTRLQGGLAFLGTVGSTSPFIGLFGTVWGIYHALTAIGIAGQASIDKVAGPVGESLIMTAIGLATAVPAVLGYNLLTRRNKGAMDRVRNFGSDIHSVLIGGYRHDVGFSASSKDAVPTTITTNQRV